MKRTHDVLALAAMAALSLLACAAPATSAEQSSESTNLQRSFRQCIDDMDLDETRQKLFVDKDVLVGDARLISGGRLRGDGGQVRGEILAPGRRANVVASLSDPASNITLDLLISCVEFEPERQTTAAAEDDVSGTMRVTFSAMKDIPEDSTRWELVVEGERRGPRSSSNGAGSTQRQSTFVPTKSHLRALSSRTGSSLHDVPLEFAVPASASIDAPAGADTKPADTKPADTETPTGVDWTFVGKSWARSGTTRTTSLTAPSDTTVEATIVYADGVRTELHFTFEDQDENGNRHYVATGGTDARWNARLIFSKFTGYYAAGVTYWDPSVPVVRDDVLDPQK
ncbi:MAG: hypothetical protein U0270_02390 [Labilithrix sp.]